jgi:hypothetical protein
MFESNRRLVVGCVPVAVGRAEVLRTVVPGTAAVDTPTAIPALQPCGAVRRCALVFFVPDILAPLVDVAVHVEEAPGVCLETVDRNCWSPVLAFRGTAG